MKNSQSSILRKQTIQLKVDKVFGQIFYPKKIILMVSKHIKRFSTLSLFRKMLTKTTKKYHYIPIRISKIKKTDMPSVGNDVEQLNSLLHSCWLGM